MKFERQEFVVMSKSPHQKSLKKLMRFNFALNIKVVKLWMFFYLTIWILRVR